MSIATMPTSQTDTLAVAQRLVELCQAGQFLQAIDELYADDITSTEGMGPPGQPLTAHGKEAVRGKNQWFLGNHTIHSSKVCGPMTNADRFIVGFEMEITPKNGPRAGQRMHMKEAGLYTVRNGKIVEEAFFQTRCE